MKELGEYLKHARVDNGVSIDEAASDLGLSTTQLENVESGNTRAFNDIYLLRQFIRQYAKYLGLDPDQVIDEFNDYLFEKTSKISLDDIKEEQKKLDEGKEEKKVTSPYTKEYKEHINMWPIIIIVIGILVVSVIIYLVVKSINRVPTRSSELIGIERRISDEYTN